MRIVGINFSKLAIERQQNINIAEKIEIKSNLDIKDIKKEDIDITKDKEVLGFYFDFTINYEPKIANINFQGNLLLLLEQKKSKDILKKWKSKEIEKDVRMLVLNSILSKCNLKALQLEEEMNLPAHIPLPRVIEQKQTSYAG